MILQEDSIKKKTQISFFIKKYLYLFNTISNVYLFTQINK